MRILITGLNGTLAPHFRVRVERDGHEVVAWDRGVTSPDDAVASEGWLADHAPDVVLHLALGSERWAERLATWCARRGRPFAFTSTAMVFDASSGGPHHPGDERTARDDYGRYKIRCEDLIRAANPEALVARIGWQIDLDGEGNNMAHQLRAEHGRNGHVRASRLWVPASSFMEDTAGAVWSLVEAGRSGVFHVDSNAADALTFVELVGLLGPALGESWEVRPNEDYQHDQRLVDDRIEMPSLRERLSAPRCRGSDET